MLGTLAPMAKRSRKSTKPVNEKVAARRAARKAAISQQAAGRTFEGLPGEADWVAMREVVPAATATARTNATHGSQDITVVTLLPTFWPAMKHKDGTVLLALQTITSSGDPSRDVAAALLEALELEPGSGLDHFELPGPGPRLQDVLDLEAPFEVSITGDFSYAVDGDDADAEEVQAALAETAESIVPTVKLDGVEAAYWCRMGEREFLRWARLEDEEALLDGLARLHAQHSSGVGEGSKFAGAFRSAGIVIPVWELAPGTEAADLEAPVAELAPRLAEAIASDEPLTADERRARAGLVARQVTLR